MFIPAFPPLFTETLECRPLLGAEDLPDPIFRSSQDLLHLGAELAPDLVHLSVSLLDDRANRLPLRSVQFQFPVHPAEDHLGHCSGTAPDHPFDPFLVDEMGYQPTGGGSQEEDEEDRGYCLGVAHVILPSDN
jgi:hypothetical protein